MARTHNKTFIGSARNLWLYKLESDYEWWIIAGSEAETVAVWIQYMLCHYSTEVGNIPSKLDSFSVVQVSNKDAEDTRFSGMSGKLNMFAEYYRVLKDGSAPCVMSSTRWPPLYGH